MLKFKIIESLENIKSFVVDLVQNTCVILVSFIWLTTLSKLALDEKWTLLSMVKQVIELGFTVAGK
jgi:hypothetical protein